jgi:CTD small phosphatase-like protein 2
MKETLLRLKKDWELIIFTASAPEYANRIINAIDPDGSIFGFRLYRKNCYLTNKGIYIKDLRIL